MVTDIAHTAIVSGRGCTVGRRPVGTGPAGSVSSIGLGDKGPLDQATGYWYSTSVLDGSWRMLNLQCLKPHLIISVNFRSI